MIDLTREEIEDFLDHQVVGRVGCHDEHGVYVVPMIYAQHGEAIYMLTTEGRKIHAMRENPAVCFEVDHYDAATGSWQSVVVQGRFEELTGDGKSEAQAILAKRHGFRRTSTEAPAVVHPIVAFRVLIGSASGRTVRRG
jgi:nitroimidazol reductase NimA-like FMN-containing flavoprotein (pyridoxamine 5'-phosphate oxidase superfamily)